MVVGVGVLEYMQVQELGRSSCSDASRLGVVVGLVELVHLGVLEVLEVLAFLGHLGFLEVLEVHLALGLLDHQLVPFVLEVLEVLGLVVVVVVGEEVVVEEGEVVGMVQQVLMEL